VHCPASQVDTKYCTVLASSSTGGHGPQATPVQVRVLSYWALYFALIDTKARASLGFRQFPQQAAEVSVQSLENSQASMSGEPPRQAA
jgi:hypothetical protein